MTYIEAVKAAEITAGYGEGIYNPAGEVTKEQLATFLIRGLGMNEEAKPTQRASCFLPARTKPSSNTKCR